MGRSSIETGIPDKRSYEGGIKMNIVTCNIGDSIQFLYGKDTILRVIT